MDLPDPGIELRSSALQVDSLPTELSGKLRTNVGEGEVSVLWSSPNSPAFRHPCSRFLGFWTQIRTYTITHQFLDLWSWTELHHQLSNFFRFQPRVLVSNQQVHCAQKMGSKSLLEVIMRVSIMG